MSVVLLSGCAAGPRVLTPRENAAARLTRQGTQLLDAGKPDSAIHMFEQAIGLDPTNGRSYYYIAQAWLAKGSVKEAQKFNNLARNYLEKDLVWANRVAQQAEQIAGRSR
jgi:tetratricopeptide (TPR) repeat protein